MTINRWEPGTAIAFREIWRGRIWSARPVIVVQDTPELVALLFPLGAHWKLPNGREQFLAYQQNGHWELADQIWPWGDSLYLIPPGEAHAIIVMWERHQRDFRGWYVNIQEPIRRTALGFDYMDLILDIVVDPDLSWHWKDEAELAQAQTMGLHSAEEVRAIRAEAERIIPRIERRAPPFSDGWSRWTPPPEWSLPVLPPGWDELA